MDSGKLLLTRVGAAPTKIVNSQLRPERKIRLRPVETVLRHLTAIDPIILNKVTNPDSPLRYEVFDRETQQTHSFQTEAEMHRWLEYQRT